MKKYCKNGCCCLIVTKYIEKEVKIIDNIRKYKAGVILHNTHEDKILIVQSRGNLWGFPKGSFEEGETFESCAIRELKEETGIILDKKLLKKFYKINNFVMYYYVQYDKNDKLEIQNSNNNDANGIGWINIECLNTLINEDDFKLNFHAKKCLQKFFKIIN